MASKPARAASSAIWMLYFFFSSRRRHTRYWRDWSSDVCSSDLFAEVLRRLESLGGTEEMRRKDLLWFVLSWAMRRRPKAERERIAAVARDSHLDRVHQAEAE